MENQFTEFKEYLNERNALDPSNAEYIYNSITGSSLKKDPEYIALWDSTIQAAIDYVPYRVNWYSWSREKRNSEDEYRSSKHNTFITRINMLARYAKEKDADCSWREILGDDRKRIGDFACYIVLARSLFAR